MRMMATRMRAIKTEAKMTNRFTRKNTPSSRAKRGICFFAVALLALATAASAEPKRPRILGIDHVEVLVSDYCSALDFYAKFKEHPYTCRPGEKRTAGVGFANSQGFIGLHTRDTSSPPNSLSEIVFWTDSASRLQRYLRSQKVNLINLREDSFSVRDPDGHLISFYEPRKGANVSSNTHHDYHIIHAGFVVRDRAAMDKFYKDILGFHVYWHGGMKDDQTNWVDMQVPDGTDWIEYMLNVPEDADQRTLGIMNHIALGVPDIHAAYKQLLTNGMKLTEEPKIGRDGKWQLNLYDPDQTRVEMMEFTPVEKPCCSEYTGPHPKP